MAIAVERRITYEEFCALDLPADGVLFELLDGLVVPRSSPTGEHQDVVLELVSRLRPAVQTSRLGVLRMGPYDVVLDQYNATMPDLIFVRAERAGIADSTGCFGAPDLVVEALSPTSIERDLRDKRATYERFGVPYYWVLDQAQEQLHCFELVAGSYVERPILGRDDVLTSPLFPGITVPLRGVFDAARLANELARTPQAPDVDPERVRLLKELHRQRQQHRDP